MREPDGDALTDPVLLAYWLARIYKVHPDGFLGCTPSEISEHVENTARMMKAVKDLGD